MFKLGIQVQKINVSPHIMYTVSVNKQEKIQKKNVNK